jgi:hypothetical protein
MDTWSKDDIIVKPYTDSLEIFYTVLKFSHYMLCFSLPSDINECAINGSNNCHEHADCINDVGSFRCSCKNGFTGNGTFCQG